MSRNEEKSAIHRILRNISHRLSIKDNAEYWTERGFFPIDQMVEVSILESARASYRNGNRSATVFAKEHATKTTGTETDKAKVFLASVRLFSAFCYEQAAELLAEEREREPEAVYNTVKGSKSMTRNARAWRNRASYRTGIKLDM